MNEKPKRKRGRVIDMTGKATWTHEIWLIPWGMAKAMRKQLERSKKIAATSAYEKGAVKAGRVRPRRQSNSKADERKYTPMHRSVKAGTP